jgi:hypothetical protein
VLEDRTAEPARQLEVQGQVEAVPTGREVLLQLTCGRIQAAGRVQDARADATGQVGQHRVVVLPRVGDAHQADGGAGEQQLPGGSVDGAVRHVEQAALLSAAGQGVLQPVQSRVARGRVREPALELVHGVSSRLSADGVRSVGALCPPRRSDRPDGRRDTGAAGS